VRCISFSQTIRERLSAEFGGGAEGGNTVVMRPVKTTQPARKGKGVTREGLDKGKA
jgi:hypothetical protein